jgi:hypothetical protein
MKPDEKIKMLELIDKLLEENEHDKISNDATRELIHTNISGLREAFFCDRMKTPTEEGYSFGLGLTRGIAEYEVSDEVSDAAHQIEAYFRTL